MTVYRAAFARAAIQWCRIAPKALRRLFAIWTFFAEAIISALGVPILPFQSPGFTKEILGSGPLAR